MAGPIQTAIGSMLNTVSGGLAIGKKLSNDESVPSFENTIESESKYTNSKKVYVLMQDGLIHELELQQYVLCVDYYNIFEPHNNLFLSTEYHRCTN